jgi:broad specificity phosphatase PhoE
MVLVRHGQAGCDGVGLKGFVGPALSIIGQQQAARAAQRLAALPLDHIYASDIGVDQAVLRAIPALQ